MRINGTLVSFGRGVAALIGCAAVSLLIAGPASANLAPALTRVGLAAAFGPATSGSGVRAAGPSDQGPVVYNGGPVMASNANYTVVWMPSNDTLSGGGFQSGYLDGVDQYFMDVAAAGASNQFNDSVTAQYNDVAGATARGASTFGGRLIDTDPLPANGCSAGAFCLTDAQLRSELESFLASQGKSGGLTSEYFLLTPPNVVSCLDGSGTSCSANATAGQSYCAYHGYTGGSAGFVYANIADLAGVVGCDPFFTTGGGGPCNTASCPYPNGPADGVLASVSDAHNESTTDPVPNTGWSLECSGGTPCGIVNPCSFGERSDPTNQTASNGAPFNMTINGSHYWLQPLYSNQASSSPSAQNSGHCVDAWTSNGMTATASFAATPQPNDVVSFDATSSTGTQAISSYVWEFNDGTGMTQSSYVTSQQPTIQHTFPADGTYTVALTVFLADGTSNGTAEQITASTTPPSTAPTVTGVSPSTGPAAGGSTVKITGTNLSGVTAVKFGAALAHFVAVSDTEVDADSPGGVGTVDVTVTTAGGTSATNPADKFAYGTAPPVASFTVSPDGPAAGVRVSFDATASRDPNSGGRITTYAWSFGDSAAGAGATPRHTYAAPGTYTVTLTVADAEGGTGSTTHSVTVKGPPPVNTAPPQITGAGVVGQPLTASTGAWSNNPTSYHYEWQDCNTLPPPPPPPPPPPQPQERRRQSADSGCKLDSGAADSPQFTPEDQNRYEAYTVRVIVTASNASGFMTATSPEFDVVALHTLTFQGNGQTSGYTVTLPVTCNFLGGRVNPACYLFILLTAKVPTSPARDATTAARARPGKPRFKLVVIGSERIRIRAGHKATARVTLNRTGRRLLAKYHKLKVKLLITEAGHTVRTVPVTFKAKPTKKPKHHASRHKHG